MHIYSFKPFRRRMKFGKWCLKFLETAIKCFLIVFFSAIPATLVDVVWYFVFFLHDIHVGHDMQEILVTAVIPVNGFLYSLLIAVLVARVFDDYKTMRTSSKRRDKPTFMLFVDEDLSQLMHAMATVLGLALLGNFMVLHYPSATQGAMVIGEVAFILSLLCIVVIEVDDPCYGFWVIKSIPSEWLECHPKEWRDKYFTVTETTTTTTTKEVTVDATPERASELEPEPA